MLFSVMVLTDTKSRVSGIRNAAGQSDPTRRELRTNMYIKTARLSMQHCFNYATTDQKRTNHRGAETQRRNGSALCLSVSVVNSELVAAHHRSATRTKP